MQFNYLITDQVIIPFFIIFFVIVSFASVSVVKGAIFKPVIALLMAFTLLILFTDLQSNEELLRKNYPFDGVIFPTIEVIEITMPVIFVEVVETGVITGGYEHEENTHHSI